VTAGSDRSGPDIAGAVSAIGAEPSRTALLFDFDGTLAPIVADPAASRPGRGVVALLDRLAVRYRTVGVISGRPVNFLIEHLPATVHLSGLYGLESTFAGRRAEHPDAERWREPVREAAHLAQQGPAGLVVEPKGLSVTLHYRSDPGLASRVTVLADEIAAQTGLVAGAAKMSVELHPPIDTDKGAVVRRLAEGALAVLYVGDDRGDLSAFAALEDLRREGVRTLAVAVDSDELPPELRRRADLVVDGPPGVVALLRALDGPT